MKWKRILIYKYGIFIGMFIGLLFGVYSNITDCHTNPGGPSGCEDKFELRVAVFEFFLYLIPLLLIATWIHSEIIWRMFILLWPAVIFGLFGLLLDWAIRKVKKMLSS